MRKQRVNVSFLSTKYLSIPSQMIIHNPPEGSHKQLSSEVVSFRHWANRPFPPSIFQVLERCTYHLYYELWWPMLRNISREIDFRQSHFSVFKKCFSISRKVLLSSVCPSVHPSIHPTICKGGRKRGEKNIGHPCHAHKCALSGPFFNLFVPVDMLEDLQWSRPGRRESPANPAEKHWNRWKVELCSSIRYLPKKPVVTYYSYCAHLFGSKPQLNTKQKCARLNVYSRWANHNAASFPAAHMRMGNASLTIRLIFGSRERRAQVLTSIKAYKNAKNPRTPNAIYRKGKERGWQIEKIWKDITLQSDQTSRSSEPQVMVSRRSRTQAMVSVGIATLWFANHIWLFHMSHAAWVDWQ